MSNSQLLKFDIVKSDLNPVVEYLECHSVQMHILNLATIVCIAHHTSEITHRHFSASSPDNDIQIMLYLWYILYNLVGVFCTTTWHNSRNIWAHSRVWTCSTHAHKSPQLWRPVSERIRSEFEFIDLIGSSSVDMWPIQLHAYTQTNNTAQLNARARVYDCVCWSV